MDKLIPDTNTLLLRKLREVGWNVTEEGCWEWKGRRSKTGGYAEFDWKGRTYKVHRAAYELWKGEIPDGLLVRHRCDNRLCINPTHLLLGTHQDNADDAVERDRLKPQKGEKNGFSRFTEADVLEIRRRRSEGELLRTIGADYNAAEGVISNIARRITWKHLP